MAVEPALTPAPVALPRVLKHPRHRRARRERLFEGLLERSLHVPRRQASEERADHERLERIAARHVLGEHPRLKAEPRKLRTTSGPLELERPRLRDASRLGVFSPPKRRRRSRHSDAPLGKLAGVILAAHHSRSRRQPDRSMRPICDHEVPPNPAGSGGGVPGPLVGVALPLPRDERLPRCDWVSARISAGLAPTKQSGRLMLLSPIRFLPGCPGTSTTSDTLSQRDYAPHLAPVTNEGDGRAVRFGRAGRDRALGRSPRRREPRCGDVSQWFQRVSECRRAWSLGTCYICTIT